jgi:hydrogenase expression/formation protein HypD
VIASAIARRGRSGRRYNIMEFCGGHTHAISRYGIADLLPPNIRLIHGPAARCACCPSAASTTPSELALERGVIVATYGDCLRVPATGGLSLLKAKARGADVRMVYSAADALRRWRRNPAREVVFFAIGFETTTPPTALAIRQAERWAWPTSACSAITC